jgi:hypothetical protein
MLTFLAHRRAPGRLPFAHRSRSLRGPLVALDRPIERAVAWLDEKHVGPVIRLAAAAVVVFIPVAQAYSGVDSPIWIARALASFGDPRWLIAFVVALVVLVPMQRYHRGSPVGRVIRDLAVINGSFAGSLFSLGEKLGSRKGRKLDDAECEALCAALLHRIRDYAALTVSRNTRSRIRATLAVPYARGDDPAQIDALRVWCYDEPHEDRGFSVIPLVIDGMMAPGAPAAYLQGGLQIIRDIAEVPGGAMRRAVPYRSVLSFPVAAKGLDGRPLAVVNIDADAAGFFDPKQAMEEIRPLVSPVVNAIGLVLSSRRKQGASYEFPR